MISGTAAYDARRRPATAWCLWCVSVSAWAVIATAEPPPDPLPAPEYSFDTGSPTVGGADAAASDVLTLSFPRPTVVLPGSAMGLFSSLDDLDALSSSNASVPLTKSFALMFSVDRSTKGAAPPDPFLVGAGNPYNVQDQARRGHAAGDQYFTTEVFTHDGGMAARAEQGDIARRNHYLVRNNFDEGGTDFSADPPTHADDELNASVPQDCVDATAHLDHSDADGTIIAAYFSLSASSPSLPLLSGAVLPSGATIFVSVSDAGPTGSCCHTDGTCEITTAAGCVNGLWLGSGATCDMCGDMDWSGACCFGDGTCTVMSAIECVFNFGWWLGPGVGCELCESGPDPFGACCQSDGTCDVVSAESCNEGLWLGPDTSCDMCTIMTEPGACCRGNGSCDTTLMDGCADGLWLGPFTTCELCEGFSIPGACCLPYGECAYLPLLECTSAPGGGIWAGPYADCEMCEFPPTSPGACCGYDGTCEITTSEACTAGDWLGSDTPCSLCGGGGLGACCHDDGTCAIANEFDCALSSGWWLGPDTSCDMCGYPPPLGGACCYPNATCASTSDAECYQTGGFWLGPGMSCAMCGFPPSAAGACCFSDTSCLLVTDVQCYDMGGTWAGPDTTCEMCGSTSPVDSACCYPDGACAMLPADLCFASGGLPDPFGRCLGDADGDGMDDNCGAPEGGTSTTRFASYAQLGLMQADDIDGLVVFDLDENGVFDGLDFVMFSLAPGSPSLATIPGATTAAGAADVFRVTVGGMPTVFASAEELGLGAPSDNVDALDLILCNDAVAHSSEHGIRGTTTSPESDAEREATPRPKVDTPQRGSDGKSRSMPRPLGDLKSPGP